MANVFASFPAREILRSGCLTGMMKSRLTMFVGKVAVGNISMRVTVRISIVGAILMNVSMVRQET